VLPGHPSMVGGEYEVARLALLQTAAPRSAWSRTARTNDSVNGSSSQLISRSSSRLGSSPLVALHSNEQP
jgi:hypothetical protein